MIPKKPAPDLIRGGYRFSEKDHAPPKSRSGEDFSMRLANKIAIVVGAGQSPGEGMGNGRAPVLRFAQEGAKVLAVDNDLSSAEETVAMARQSGGECAAFAADVTKEATLAAMAEEARRRWGRIDVLHYNVGVSIAGGDAPLSEIAEAAFDRI